MNAGGVDQTIDRRTRVLDMAAATFLRGGYTSTTMDAVARGAGISKKTLYQMYPSKLALLDALLRDRMEDAAPLKPSTSEDSEQRLVEYMSDLSKVVLSHEQVALVRMIVSDSRDGAVLAAAFRRIAVERRILHLQQFLAAELSRNGWTELNGDIEQTTKVLFHLTIGQLLIDRLLQFNNESADPEHHIRGGVRFFLRAMSAPLPTHPNHP